MVASLGPTSAPLAMLCSQMAFQRLATKAGTWVGVREFGALSEQVGSPRLATAPAAVLTLINQTLRPACSTSMVPVAARRPAGRCEQWWWGERRAGEGR